MIQKVTGYEGAIQFDPHFPDGTARKLCDNSKINRMGWQAKTGLEEGLRLAYRDYLCRFHSLCSR